MKILITKLKTFTTKIANNILEYKLKTEMAKTNFILQFFIISLYLMQFPKNFHIWKLWKFMLKYKENF